MFVYVRLQKADEQVLSRCTDSLTHIIYKSGKPTTLSWWRKQDEDVRPHIVGISWVTRCKEKGSRLDESTYVVEVDKEDIFQKVRASACFSAMAAYISDANLWSQRLC